MFSVTDRPCSPKLYNRLPGIGEADEAIRPLQNRLDQLVKHGSEACRSAPFPRGEVGAFLLHKHWELRDGESMIERSAALPSGRPALVTSARRLISPAAIAPCRFQIDPKRRELQALEFSSDPFVVDAWQALQEDPSFLERICGLVSDSGMSDQIGFAIFDRASVPVAAGEQMVEENGDRESVLCARVLRPEEEDMVVPTGWAFVAETVPDAVATGCIKYCMGAGSAPHCKHHYARPQRTVPPPLCRLHD
jgi:hypothetical protein